MDELASLAADLRTYVEVHQSQGARWPTADLPEATPEASTEPATDAAPTAAPATKGAPAREVVAPPARPAAPDRLTLSVVSRDLGDCTRCRLHKGRTNLVFGVGSETADIVFVGEGPGYYEDQAGEPFVGKAGELLDRIITNVLRLKREDVYICNVVKCRPPQNRDPQPDEVASCAPFLRAQLEAIKPAIVVGLGRFAVQTLLKTEAGIGRLRGQAHPFGDAVLIPTYHPAYLLRNPADKRKTLEDMKLVRAEYARLTGRELGSVLSGAEARDRS